ncbi:MAG: VTT domain-containing protein [Gammaproteobacteria bacterium]|nr:VTT domain-containing protein [Gammaproteobacteria bacterium]
MIHKYRYKLAIIGLLIALGIGMELAGLLDARQLLAIAREYSQHWWLIVVLILMQALLFTFALAGSLFLWIAAPLYSPPVATLILAAGGTLGGIGAYLFSTYLTEEWQHKIENSHSYRILQAQDNFFTLFAMRVFPGFPHAIVNYSSGVLKARLSHFIVAAILGISIKSYLYANVIYAASSSLSLELLLDFKIYAPLVALSLVSALLVYVNYRMTKGRE